jgi:UTP--glucose-1-phosphate uridylyltransferase
LIRAVLPVAGLGTRFLPVTRSVPKELLPVFDRPCVEYAVLEALDAGIEELIFVTAAGKEALVDHFRCGTAVEARLARAGRTDALRELRELASRATVITVDQEEPRGLGHAVWTAAPHTGDDAFAVLLPDNILDCPTPAIGQLLAVHARTGGAVVGVEQVPVARTPHYGVCEGIWVDGQLRIARVVEKPPLGTSVGRHVFVGRYVLPARIHDLLAAGEPGAQGELQLSDALATLAAQGDLTGVLLDGPRLDTGTPLGLLDATLHLALKRPELAQDVRALLARHLGR